MYIYVYIYIYTHTYLHVHIYMHTCIHTYIQAAEPDALRTYTIRIHARAQNGDT